MKRDYEQIAQQYEQDVLSGRIPACKIVKTVAQRNIRDKERWSDTGPYIFSSKEGVRVCSFIDKSLAEKGGSKEMPDKLEPWLVWTLFILFGWRRRSDGRRRFTKFDLQRRWPRSQIS